MAKKKQPIKFGKIAIAVLVLSALAILVIWEYSRNSVAFEKDILESQLIAADQSRDNGLAVVIDGKVDKERLDALSQMQYKELKTRLGVKSDFAIYFVDNNGELVPLTEKLCIGSSKASVAGVRCS